MIPWDFEYFWQDDLICAALYANLTLTRYPSEAVQAGEPMAVQGDLPKFGGISRDKSARRSACPTAQVCFQITLSQGILGLMYHLAQNTLAEGVATSPQTGRLA